MELDSRIVLAAALAAGALLAGLWLSVLLGMLVDQLVHKKMWTWLKAIMALLFAGALFAGAVFSWLNSYKRADESAQEGLLSDEYVMVHELENGYFFDGWGEYNAILFYGEKRLQETAYAPLLKAIARQGTDCFLVEMPYAMAELDPERPKQIIDTYSWYSWYLMVHSTGNEAGCAFFDQYRDRFAGMILLDSVPLSQLDENQLLISLLSETDSPKTGAAYETAMKKQTCRRRENTVTSGSRAGFVSDGTKGEEGTLTPELQRQLTAVTIRLSLYEQ
jgi:hypothetical protein